MKPVLFVAFLVLVPALVDRLEIGPPAPHALGASSALAADAGDRVSYATDRELSWLCGARS